MSLDLNAIAEEILVAHQRHKGGCLCGWSELGKSHPGHQVAMLCEAGIWNDCAEARAELARCVERLDLDAWERLEAERDRLAEQLAEAAAEFRQAWQATRRLTAVLTANAPRLDVPFTNADGSPWELHVKPAMYALREALGIRAWQPSAEPSGTEAV